MSERTRDPDDIAPDFRGIVTEKCSCCNNWRECAHFWTTRNQGYICEECAGIAVAEFREHAAVEEGRRAVERGELLKCCPGCGDTGVQQIINEFDKPEWCATGLKDEDGDPVYICFCPWCGHKLAEPSEAPLRMNITTNRKH